MLGTLMAISVADPDDFWPDPDPFRKRPDLDPDPDLNKFSDKFLLEFVLRKYALKSIFLTQKVKKQRFLKYLWLLHTQKYVYEIGSFIKARIRIRIGNTDGYMHIESIFKKTWRKIEWKRLELNAFKIPMKY
jgi:hypothetical protein